MSNRRRGMSNNPFDRDEESLDRLDSELFGDLERVGRPVVLRLDEIRLDGGTQPRAALNHDVIGEYAEAIQDGAVFPPVDVFYDGANYWLADGFHRWHGHDQANKDTIRAVIHQGSQRDAVLYSVGVNAEHGLRRTNEDKRRAVIRLLHDPEWSQWSDREIARQCKVSNRFVGNLRKGLSVNGSQIDSDDGGTDEPETRKVRRGDTVYEQRVSTDKRQEVTRQRAQRSTSEKLTRMPSPRLVTRDDGYDFNQDSGYREDALVYGSGYGSGVERVSLALAALLAAILEAADAIATMDQDRFTAGELRDLEDAATEVLRHLQGYRTARGQWEPGLLDLVDGLRRFAAGG